MENSLRTGGCSVTLAIDTQIQQIVEDSLANWSKYPPCATPAIKSTAPKTATAAYTEVVQPQAAAVVLDYRTGG